MSTTIDNRVLEMRFDNKQFENGVATSMSTLDKLKAKLNLSGASKGLENVGKAAKNMNFSGMTGGIDTVTARFSAMQVAGITAISRITNAAMTAGNNIAKALTIDPITTGFQEYETQMGAVQTILANTQKEGTNVAIVNKALDELNAYADQTIYNFTEMTKNIGTFTAAGVKLDTSVNAIKGIANIAAISGSTSQQASSAMYQLSQALAAGKVSLMDWNSVVNAGMGGQVFQDALIRTSELLQTGAKDSIAAYGSFRESLTQGQWLTTEVLTETLNQFAGVYDKAELMAQGFTEAQANEIVKLSETAIAAATEVKTFSGLWDTLKESAQSGWSQTWRLIIGDFEQAKGRLTELSNLFGGFISGMSDNRNNLLETGLSSSFDVISRKLNTLGIETDSFQNKIRELSGVNNDTWDKMIEKCGSFEKALVNMIKGGKIDKSVLSDSIKSFIGDVSGATKSTGEMVNQMEKYGEVVDKVIHGDFGNGEARVKALTDAGYEYATIQGLVNDKVLGTSKATSVLNDKQVENIDNLSKLSDEQLKAKEYTDEQIEAIRFLSGAADQAGVSINDLIENIEKPSGAELIWDSLFDVIYSIVDPLKAVKKAWTETFEPMSGNGLYGILESINSITEAIKTFATDSDNLDKVTRSFKGLFAIVDIITTILGSGFKFGFEALTKILEAFDMNILDLTANIGDAVVGFRDWLFENNKIAKAFDKLSDKLPDAIDGVKEWIDSFKEIPAVDSFITAIENIKKAFSDFSLGEIDLTALAQELGTNLANALLSIPDMMVQIGKDVIAGFQNGIEDGLSGSIIGKVISFCSEFIAAFASAMGCHSPSVLTHEIGVNTIQGFINGLKEMLEPTISFVTYIGDQIINAFKTIWELVTDESGNVEWDKIFAGGLLVSAFVLLKKFVDAVDGISDAIGGIGGILEGAEDALKKFSKVLTGFSWELKAKAIQKMAISIAILSASLYALTTIDDTAKLWNAVGIIGALSAIVLGLAAAMELMSKASITYEKGKLNVEGLKASILQIGATLLMLGAVVKIIGEMKPEQAKAGFIALTGLMVEVIAFMAIVGLAVKGGAADNIDKVGKLMTKLAIAMILMTAVVKLASGLSADEMLKGVAFASAFALFVIAITKVAKSAGNNVSKVGGMVLKVTFAMGLMVGVVKLVNLLSASEMLKGVAFAAAFGLFVKALVKATTIGKKQQIAKIGGLVLSLTISLGLMVSVVKLVGQLSAGEMLKGVAFVGAFMLFVKAMVKIVSVGNETEVIKVGGTLLALSVAIGILAGISALLGMLDIAGLAKGVIAVGFLSAFMTGMIAALKGVDASKDMPKTIMNLVIAIGAMSIAVAALSMIETGDLAASTIALGSLMGVFALMEKSLSGIKDVSIKPILALTLVVAALGGIIYGLSSLNPGSSIEIAASISVLMLALSKSLEMVDHVGKSAMKAIGPLAVLGLIASGIGLVLAGLSKLNPGPTLEIATSMSEVLIAMSASALILSKIGPMGSASAMGAAALLGVVFVAGAILAAIGGIVGKIDKAQEFLDSGIPILESIGKALGSFVGGIIGGIGEGITGSLQPMAEDITSMMEELSKASDKASGIKGESFDGVKKLLETLGSIGLTTVGTSISDVFTLGGTSMEKFQEDGVAFFDAMKSIGEAASGTKINSESFNAVIGAAEKLSGLQSSLSKMDGVISWFTGDRDLSTFGTKISSFMSSMSTAMTTANEITVGENFGSIISAAQQLSSLQSSLEQMDGVIKWFTGDRDLSTFGTKISSFMSSMSTAMTTANEITVGENFGSVISAAQQLSSLQSSLEQMDGVISWFTGDRDLSTFGTKISSFMSSMSTAMTTANEITVGENFGSVISAAQQLSSLQSSLEQMDGVISWFTGDRDLSTFGTKISSFMSSMGDAMNEANEISVGENFGSVISAAQQLSALESLLEPIGSVIDWFNGKDDLGDFGERIYKFAEAIGKLKTGMGEDGISTDVVNSVTNAGSALIALQEALPETGWFDGKLDLDTFSEYVNKFAEAMSEFSNTATNMKPEAVDVAITAANRIKNLVNALADLETDGVATFAGVGAGDGALVNIGQAIGKFGESVGEMDTAKVTAAVDSAISLKNLISSLSGLETEGIENFKVGIIGAEMKSYSESLTNFDPSIVSSSISSARNLASFISGLTGLDSSGVINFKIAQIGLSLQIYSNAVAGFNTGAVMSSITAGDRLASFVNGLAGINSSGVVNFKVIPLGNAISGYSSAVASVDYGAVTTSISAALQIKSFINGLSGFNASGVDAFKSAVSSLAQTNIGGLTSAFSGSASQLSGIGSNLVKSLTSGFSSGSGGLASAADSAVSSLVNGINGKAGAFLTAGTNVMSNFVKGIASQTGPAQSTAVTVATTAATSTAGYYGTFYSMGSYVASGFVTGIAANISAAANAAASMAAAASAAARANLRIHSPSRVFMKIGSYVPQGFAKGIKMYGSTVKRAAGIMTDSAVDSTQKAILKISDAFNNDIDTQPTIRPVLDLSDIKSGAAVVDGLFSNGQSIGVMANLNAISSSMSNRGQNGSSDDIVYAINKLSKKLDNVGGNSYNINGVTYDDGSNITSAVETLIRAAKIERRS